MTRAPNKMLPALTATSTALLAALAIWTGAGLGQEPPPATQVPVPPPAGASFKLTFGLKRKAHGINWSGGLRNPAQVRSIHGWHFDAQDRILPPDRWDIALRTAGGELPAKAVILDLLTSEEQPVTFFVREGDFQFIPASVPYGVVHFIAGFDGDVSVERVPSAFMSANPDQEDDDPALARTRSGELWMAWVAYRTRERSKYTIKGADEVFVARSQDGRRWSAPTAITLPGDHFRVALGEDRRGRLWCVYGLQKGQETGNFDLFGRYFDGTSWSGEHQLTKDTNPDTFHRMASDGQGRLYLVWMGYRGQPAQSDILVRVNDSGEWGEEINVSQSPEDDWEPSVGATPGGKAWIAWDSHRKGRNPAESFDLLTRTYNNGTLGAVSEVSATPRAEMRASIAVDGEARAWIAWEEAGANWGKDTGYEDPKHRIKLRPGGSELHGPVNSRTAMYRVPRVAVFSAEGLRQPVAALEDSFPPYLQKNLYLSPVLGSGADGRIWLMLRHQYVAKGRNAGHLFDYYATTLEGEGNGQRWIHPFLLPRSTGRPDTLVATVPGFGAEMVTAVVGDSRRLPVGLPGNNEISTMVIDGRSVRRGAPVLTSFVPSRVEAPVTHPLEAEQVQKVRSYRIRSNGRNYKIMRGDLHRHTSISMDGAIDGTLVDLYRYAMDAAAFDYIAVTDHNYGAWLDTDEPDSPNTDDVYSWWRTQKSADLFYVPGRFVPLYAYERSINFPLGHRNIIHVRRGVFSLRVPRLHVAERPEYIERDAQNLWEYLRSTDGVGLPHTSGTNMGTDWRLRDDDLEPVVEIYQGDRNSYEEQGGPRAALPEATGPGGAGRQPFQKGLVWNALGAGYRMGFIASSDHFSTHISYANLLVPDRVTTRADLQDALRQRHTYASTDNIVLDFRAGGALQGDQITASSSPQFQLTVAGTEPILRIEIIKNNRVIHTAKTGTFSFRDEAVSGSGFEDTAIHASSQISDWTQPETGIRPRPAGKESYYYVRVIQSFSAATPDVEGEIAWSSPIFVTHK